MQHENNEWQGKADAGLVHVRDGEWGKAEMIYLVWYNNYEQSYVLSAYTPKGSAESIAKIENSKLRQPTLEDYSVEECELDPKI